MITKLALDAAVAEIVTNEFNTVAEFTIVKLCVPVNPLVIPVATEILSSSVAVALGPVEVNLSVISLIDKLLSWTAAVEAVPSTVTPLVTPVNEVAVTPV